MARTWNYKENKPFNSKFLLLDYLLDGLLCSILILSNGIAFFSLIHSPEESMVSKREIERRKGTGQGIGRGWNKFPR
jgi:hypothetical protein